MARIVLSIAAAAGIILNPVIAAPKPKAEMRWAGSWDAAIEEAWLRDCPIILHLHADKEPASQRMYSVYHDPNVAKRSESFVNVALVELDDSHPFDIQQDAEDHEIAISRVFTGRSRIELQQLIARRGKQAFLGTNPADRPAVMGFRSTGGQELVVQTGELRSADLIEFLTRCSVSLNSPRVVPLDDYENFVADRKRIEDIMEQEKWLEVAQEITKLRSRYGGSRASSTNTNQEPDRSGERFLSKITDILDMLNAHGLAHIDRAMDLPAGEERRHALHQVVKDFSGLDAASRAKVLLDRQQK